VTSFNDIEFAAIDFESSGFDDDGSDEAIQIGIAIMRHSAIDPASNVRQFISPQRPRPISDAAHAVHRIHQNDLIGAPNLISLWPTIRDSLNRRIIVAHGAGTEKRFLRAFPLHGFRHWVDTLQTARTLLPDMPSHRLGHLIEILGLNEQILAVCPDLSWHDALFDAVASLVLLRHLVCECAPENTPLAAFGIPDQRI